ncbi:hypothetical protein BD779DRAFT_259926 [Infundibulicybe gibba]|nr:hypothetical protein BD779DRAFT_259926 [Infundibulicybe gibba]
MDEEFEVAVQAGRNQHVTEQYRTLEVIALACTADVTDGPGSSLRGPAMSWQLRDRTSRLLSYRSRPTRELTRRKLKRSKILLTGTNMTRSVAMSSTGCQHQTSTRNAPLRSGSMRLGLGTGSSTIPSFRPGDGATTTCSGVLEIPELASLS